MICLDSSSMVPKVGGTPGRGANIKGGEGGAKVEVEERQGGIRNIT